MSDSEDRPGSEESASERSTALNNVVGVKFENNDRNRRFELHRLCSVCSGIVKKSEVLSLIAEDAQLDEPVIEVWPHHGNEAELKNSITRGCHLCHLLYAQTGVALSKYRQVVDEGLPEGQLHLYLSTRGNVQVQHPRGKPRFHFEFGLGKPNQKDGKIRPHEPLLFAREISNAPPPHDSFLTASTGSDATLMTMKNWMSLCLNKHKHCSNQGEFPVYLPRRLLKISNCPLTPKIRLTEIGIQDKSKIAYTTLSHCWGGRATLKLQQSNYVPFLEDIDFNELPQLFKDAVRITLRLGFEYLWIDALCIIQDHGDDWYEALRMSEIFGNSVCTISALAASDSDESCIYDRSSLSFVSCRIRTRSDEDLDLISWRARLLLNLQGPNYNLSALNQRSWVMQERYLTPRNIYFSQNQLWWQCCEASFSEFRQKTYITTPFLRAELRRGTRPTQTIDKPIFVNNTFWGGQFAPGHAKMDWHRSWWILVERYYTAGKLSREEDRWPAISGIAQIVQNVTGVVMIAGLWTSHLMFDLLWCSDPSESDRRIDNGQPSWSWLSVNSKIYHLSIKWKDAVPIDKRFTARLLELPERVPESANQALPYFYLPSNPLSLLIEAPMMKFPEVPDGKNFAEEYESGVKEPDIKNGEPISSIVASHLLWGYNCWTPDYAMSNEELSDAWVLQWTRQEDRERTHKHHTHSDHLKYISGLVVKPLDNEQSRWCRIGRFGVQFVARKGKVIGPLKTVRLY